ncbi:Uncharacterised protein [Chlamydia trachomatis]|nr:Uncharacterised protein [Chlamydia trachomatis]
MSLGAVANLQTSVSDLESGNILSLAIHALKVERPAFDLALTPDGHDG